MMVNHLRLHINWQILILNASYKPTQRHYFQKPHNKAFVCNIYNDISTHDCRITLQRSRGLENILHDPSLCVCVHGLLSYVVVSDKDDAIIIPGEKDVQPVGEFLLIQLTLLAVLILKFHRLC